MAQIEEFACDELFDFIKSHINDDCQTLRLKFTLPWQRFAIDQIEARAKTVRKLPSFLENSKFLFPSTLLAEQATNEVVARFHASLFEQCETVVDLTAGLCIDSHFISHKCRVTAVEVNVDTYAIDKCNITLLGSNIELINDNAETYVKKMPIFDAAFIDPSRRDSHSNRVNVLTDCSPNLLTILPCLKRNVKYLIVKASPLLNTVEVNKQISGISDFWIVSLKNDCKELLFKVDFQTEQTRQMIHTLNFDGNGDCQILSFENTPDKNQVFANPVVGNYLYEPNSSITKVGLYDALILQFKGLAKIAPNSHLFVSNMLFVDFPGRIFKITDIIPFKKQNLKELSSKFQKLNVAIRNFPLSANELKKNLKMKDGGDHYLFGTTLCDKRAVLILCEKYA